MADDQRAERGVGAEGAEERFRRFYEQHHTAVSRYVRRRVPDADADDLITETFVVAWRRFDTLVGEPLPWLYAVARNLIRNHRRAAGRRADLVRLVGDGAAQRPHGDVEGQVVSSTTMGQAFASLRESDREVLRLVAWEGLSSAAAARSLGCTTATFTVRLHRARRRLEDAIAAIADDIPTATIGESDLTSESGTIESGTVESGTVESGTIESGTIDGAVR